MKRTQSRSKKGSAPPPSTPDAPPSPPAGPVQPEQWVLRLYVAGQTPKSLFAFGNLKRICDARLAGRYSIEVIDLLKVPHVAADDQVVALPTLVRRFPLPTKRLIGNLSDVERVTVGMDLPALP
jgi:circadian clock protein KaiB